MNNYLSIDIGGTNIKFALLDRSGNVIFKEKVSTSSKKKDFLRNIDHIVKNFDHLKGIAFCAPGQIINNTIHFGGSLKFLDGINFQQRYENLNIPIAVINDGKASVLAESWLGSLKDVNNCASITLGTGIGGGIIVNNQLVLGENAQAGELSFMRFSTDPKSHEIAGFSYSAVEMISKINVLAGNEDLKNGKKAFEQINHHNKVAVEIFNKFCAGIASIIFNIQSVVDLKKIAIGGGISAQPIVIKTINDAYDDIMNNTSIIKQTLTKPIITSAKFKNDANLYGALYNLLLQENKEEISRSNII
ncbi:ROK family protein [uncultured Lactobacillus sp.]|uniref:ROK family protein n=1 Tax=uncultured Lactobacillus sp. TaxID=153152 RepID=UPI002804A18B|nr:ROK family protein [uncultured Lactobacillus sp.]